jgi:hypothetical protein
VAVVLGLWGLPAAAGKAADTPAQQAPSEPPKTLKERLGDKASDDQRVDNCKVPAERRGSKARPDACRR